MQQLLICAIFSDLNLIFIIIANSNLKISDLNLIPNS